MRASPLLIAALSSLLFVTVPASACGGGTGSAEDPPKYCHDYWIHVGEDGTLALHANENGQFQLSVANQYVEQDIDYVHYDGNSLFSIWQYEEANGQPGLQRSDEVCNNTPEGESSDVIWC